MNIKVQCCGLVLIVLLDIIYSSRKTLKLTTSMVFKGCFYSSMCCLILDILSVFGIVYREMLPEFLPILICKSYLVSLVLVSLLATVYVATSISFRLPGYKKFISFCILFGIVIAAFICALPISMHEVAEENLVWTDGPSCYMTYFGVFILLMINLIQIFRHVDYIYVRQRRTVLIWMLVWIGAACIQAMFTQLLIVGYACALGIAAVYAQFESPELNLDRTTGLFNYSAFMRYADQLYSGTKNFYIIAVMFENAAWQDVEGNYTKASSPIMFDTFLEIPGADAFKIMEKEVLLIFTKRDQAMSAWQSFMKHPKTVGVDASYYLIEDPRCVSSQRELMELLQYVGQQRKNSKSGSFYPIYDDIVSEMVSERKMTQEIVDALAEDRVVVYYQPIFSVEKKCFTSAEALVRIIDRDGKLIPPGAFIRIAESNGMIIELGKRVFEKVCRFFKENGLQDFGMQYIEVNLSVVQCGDDRLADNFINIVSRSRIDPASINLEITESASLQAKQTLITNMERMIDYGIHFSLDDFGTGASNLNYIVDMPVRIVKFDREMIQAYFASGKAKYVMDAAMHMIHGMGLEIVAEGIETEEQYKKMEEIKMNFIQGYYFSKPLPEQEFLEFLRRQSVTA